MTRNSRVDIRYNSPIRKLQRKRLDGENPQCFQPSTTGEGSQHSALHTIMGSTLTRLDSPGVPRAPGDYKTDRATDPRSVFRRSATRALGQVSAASNSTANKASNGLQWFRDADRQKIFKTAERIFTKRGDDGKPRPGYEFVLQSVTYKLQLQQRRLAKRFVFRPGDSPFLNKWDVMGVIVLTYTALFTPFEVSFMPGLVGPSAWLEPRFLLARLIDVFFTCDLILQFFIATQRVEPNGAKVWNDKHRDIARTYLSSWFWFDLGTLIPSIFDILPTLSDTESIDGAAIFRTFRVLRFIKILRVARAGRIMTRWASRITLQHSTKTILWCIFRMVISVHWFACVFALQASLHSSPEETWLSREYYDYCRGDSVPSINASYNPGSATGNPPRQAGGRSSAQSTPLSPVDDPEWCPGLTPGVWYIAGFTWSLMIITGYGGTDYYPSSKSVAETFFVMLLNLCGAVLWTQILADFCDVATNGDPAEKIFQQNLDELNTFISLHKMPRGLRTRMREFVHVQRFCQREQELEKSVASLSPALQVEVIM